MQIFFEIQIH